jgi:hypothetical protein
MITFLGKSDRIENQMMLHIRAICKRRRAIRTISDWSRLLKLWFLMAQTVLVLSHTQ